MFPLFVPLKPPLFLLRTHPCRPWSAESWTDAHLAMAAMDGRPNCDPKGCDGKEEISRRWKTGWWFGTWILWLSIYWEESSQLTQLTNIFLVIFSDNIYVSLYMDLLDRIISNNIYNNNISRRWIGLISGYMDILNFANRVGGPARSLKIKISCRHILCIQVQWK